LSQICGKCIFARLNQGENPSVTRFMSLISGSGKGFSLEHSIFNVFVFILIMFAVLASAINLITHMHFVVNLLSVAGTFIMLAFFYHTRVVGVFKPWHILFLLFFST